MTLLDEIKAKSKTEFRPAIAAEIDALLSLGVSEEALTFYRESTPAKMAEIGKVRLHTIRDLVSENTDYVPGAYTLPCGYVVFASTNCGDAFCFDIRAIADGVAPVVLIGHDLEPENEQIERAVLEQLAKPIASTLENFLQAFVLEKIDTVPLYPSLNLDRPKETDQA